MKGEPVSILIVEDQELIRLGLSLSFQRVENFAVIGQAGDGETGILKAIELKPSLALVDIGLPGVNGIEVSRRIKAVLPATKVIMLTLKDDDDSVFDALGAGADGYCLKDISQEQLTAAIATVMDGHFWMEPRLALKLAAAFARQMEGLGDSAEVMTAKQREILDILSRKLSVAEIGKLLSFPESDVQQQLMKVTQVRDITDKASLDNPATSDQRLFVGTIFAGRYRVDRFIGHGGMGRVYQATHLLMDRRVALKLLHPQFINDKKLVKKFHQESKSASLLQHPNIVTVYDFGVSEEGIPYLVMDYIEGCGLDILLKEQGKLPLKEFLAIFIPVCEGLAEAHEHGIVHCDLKPSNIVVERSGKGIKVKIVDFGLARIQPQGVGIQFQATDAFEIVGSPLYMSPEQCRGKHLDYRTDIYSLGCVMFELLTGRPIFDGATPMLIFMKQVEEKPLALTKELLGYEPPAVLSYVVAKTLEKNPDDRIQTVGELLSVLKGLQS